MTLFQIGQIFGYIATVEGFLIFLSTKRDRIIVFKCISDLLWMFNYFFIGVYLGGVLNAIGVVRDIVFYESDKKKWANHIFWLFFFMAISVTATIITWTGYICLLPICGTCMAIVSFYVKKPIITKFIAFPMQLLWLFYAYFTGNTAAVVCNVIMLLSSVIGLIREWNLKRKTKENNETLNESVD